MKYKGVELILDNFRSVLFEYSVDIQDVVRSAILDNIDISKYIAQCKDDPYRLDQIRLSLKDGISGSLLKISSASMLYRIRKLNLRGVDLKEIERQLNGSRLCDECISYMLDWLSSGISISCLNLSIIPESLLEVFDYGLRSGFDMKDFNNGYLYQPEYVKLCLRISKNGKDVDYFLNGEWDIDVLKELIPLSKLPDGKWNFIMSVIDSSISIKRWRLVLPYIRYSGQINDVLKKLQTKENGEYVYSDDCLSIVYQGYLSNVNIEKAIEGTTDPEVMRARIMEMELDMSKRTSGKLRRR